MSLCPSSQLHVDTSACAVGGPSIIQASTNSLCVYTHNPYPDLHLLPMYAYMMDNLCHHKCTVGWVHFQARFFQQQDLSQGEKNCLNPKVFTIKDLSSPYHYHRQAQSQPQMVSMGFLNADFSPQCFMKTTTCLPFSRNNYGLPLS